MTALQDQARWPPQRFFWALLDVRHLKRRERQPEQLSYLLERFVPEPLDDLHAVFAPVDGDAVLACAARRSDLADLDEGCEVLAPEALPSCAIDRVQNATVENLNLLTGPFEPRSARRARWSFLLQCDLVVFLLGAVLCWSSWQQTSIDAAHARSTTQHSDNIMRLTLNDVEPTDSLPLALQFQAELRRMRQTRQTPTPDSDLADAGQVLEALFNAWPKDAAVDVQSMALDAGSIKLRVQVPTAEDAQTLADSLAGFDDVLAEHRWSGLQPQFSTNSEGVLAVLSFERDVKEEDGRS